MEILQLEAAVEMLLNRTRELEEVECIPIEAAVGHVLAEDVIAKANQPPFPRSPLDGYAVRSEDIKGASADRPSVLQVTCEVMAGQRSGNQVGQGMAARIMTGAPIPPGADCIVRQEDTDYGESEVKIYTEQRAYDNYCFEGEDYKKGAVLLKKGALLNAVEIGVLSSAGKQAVCVYRKPRVMVLATGDELVLPGSGLCGGQIYDSNLHMLTAQLKLWGMDVITGGLAGDDAALVAEEIRKYEEIADLLVTTGGVSVGKKDIMHEVLGILKCERIFWKISMKPGMPTLCGQYKDKLLICLSGNPYGAIANLELLVRPLLAKISRREDLQPKKVWAVLENAYSKKSGTRRYVRAVYGDGKVNIASGSNDSGILSNMCGCNCLIEIPAGNLGLLPGDTVQAVLL